MRTSLRLRSLLLGALAGALATTAWLGLVAVFPPVPANAVGAMLLVLLAMALAGWATRRGDPWVAGLTAGVVGCWSLVALVAILMPVVPDPWVPHVVTAAMTPADNVRESRIETVDPYVALALVGIVLGAGLVLALSRATAGRIRRWLVPPVTTPHPQVRQP